MDITLQGSSLATSKKQCGWVKFVVGQLSKDIQKEYPGIQGFFERNLRNMRLFHSEIQRHEKLQLLVAEISLGSTRYFLFN